MNATRTAPPEGEPLRTEQVWAMVEPELADRIKAASEAMFHSTRAVSPWMRIAALEKLERDTKEKR